MSGLASLTICPHNNLLIKHPAVINIWNYEINQRGPETYSSSPYEKVWWKCSSGHIYDIRISSKFRRPTTKCPLCYGSIGEQSVSSVLKKLGIEFSISYLPNRRWTCD